jgi:hypothetical protein
MLSEISRIKPIFKSDQIISKELLKNAQCLLTISVGQEVHESEKFSTTLKLVDDHFGSCITLIDDTLQRHTMALQRTEDADFFYEQSLKEGDLWLERNEKYLSKMSIPNKIIRWNKWLEHSHYSQKNEQLRLLLKTDLFYKKIFDDTIQTFLGRYYTRLTNQKLADFEKDVALCFDYLLEECTALCLWPELNCHFEVYPSKRNLAMDTTHRYFVLPKYPDLLHSLAIKFKNRKQLKAQRFEALLELE